ncbi:hypothetical protein CAPTEDRAFT_145171, partial [Capitella teleta]
HWMKYNDLCHPCVMQYDYIAKMETLESDVEHVLDQIGAPALTIGHSNESKGKNLTKAKTDYLKELDATGSLDALWNHFSKDADMFGYKFDRENFQTLCESSVNHSLGYCG